MVTYGYGDEGQGPPPLPPRSRSTMSGEGDQPSTANPPPIPPRPLGFGYQPVRQTTSTHHVSLPPYPHQQETARESPASNTLPISEVGPFQPNTSALPLVSQDPGRPVPRPEAQIRSNYPSDIAHHFPNGIIPPPPPIHHLRGPEPGTYPPQHNVNFSQNGYQNNANQANSVPVIPLETPLHVAHPTGTLQHQAAVTQESSTQPGLQGNLGLSENDIGVMSERLQDVSLSSPKGVVATSTIGLDHQPTTSKGLQPPTVLSPEPPFPGAPRRPGSQETTQIPTDSPGAQTQRDPQAVSECIGIWADFKTTWYTHPASPDYYICSSCYEDHIRGSQFRDYFKGEVCDDGKPRICRFSKPRMKDDLFKSAVATRSLDAVVQYMVLRSSIQECKGTGGANGTAGIQWYRPKNNVVPDMVICQACYEDQILTHRDFAENFEPAAHPQPADQMWSCDMAVPYVIREYNIRAKSHDWVSFVREVSARLSLRPCPGGKGIYPDGPDGRKWFTPTVSDTTSGFLVCAACFCDYVLHTGQESRWRSAGDELVPVFGVSVRCCLGGRHNVAMLAGRMLETGQYDELFWPAVETVCTEPACETEGIPAGAAKWYTLRSNPPGFGVCGACYATIVAPYGVADMFVRKTDIAPDATLICTFNSAMPRGPMYASRFLVMMLTRDPGPLERFASEYAYILPCRGAKHIENVRWWGWGDCTICPECQHEFVRGTALADAMPLQGVQIAGSVMCEMYSARMRKLYLAACAADPPADPTPLLEASRQRRAVWRETVPLMERLTRDQRLKFGRQQMLQSQSSFYTHIGRSHAAAMQSGIRYDVTGLGTGFGNQLEITGAQYGRQAAQMGSQIGGGVWVQIEMLEKRWEEVE